VSVVDDLKLLGASTTSNSSTENFFAGRFVSKGVDRRYDVLIRAISDFAVAL
jgi:hypothetical protein